MGPAETIRAQYPETSFEKVIDATGMCVLPGEYQLEFVMFFSKYALIYRPVIALLNAALCNRLKRHLKQILFQK